MIFQHRKHVLFVLLALMVALAAACQSSPTPTPTTRPTAAPATDVPAQAATEEATEAMDAMSMTEEATEMMDAMSMTEEATEAMAAATEEGVEVAVLPTSAVTEEATEMMMATEAMDTLSVTDEATATMEMMATDEPTEEATEMMATMEMTDAADVAMGMGESVMISPDSEIVIGLAVGLSGEGIAPLGSDIQRGAELALAARPTVSVGGTEFPVRLDVQDDQCSAEGGQAVANRFAADESIVGVVGPMCSSACLAAAPIFDAAGYTTISPSCTNEALSTSGFTSFNRVVASDAFQGQVVAAYIYNELGARRIATIHDGSAYGEGLVSLVERYFAELGGEVVASDAITVGDTDFRGLLEDIAQEDPDLIYFVGFPAEGARLAGQRADAGLEEVTFMGADGIFTPEFIQLAGSDAEGIYASKSVSASSAALEGFFAAYQTAYGDPTGPFNSNGYDGVNLFLDAIEAVGSIDANGDLVVTREAVAEYIRSVADYQGLVGVLTNDGSGEMVVSEYGFGRVENGAFVDQSVGSIAEGDVSFAAPEVAAPAAEATAEMSMTAEMDMTAEMQMTAEATPAS